MVLAVAVVLIALFASGFFGPQDEFTAVRQTTITTVHDANGTHVETVTNEIPGLVGKRPASWGLQVKKEYGSLQLGVGRITVGPS